MQFDLGGGKPGADAVPKRSAALFSFATGTRFFNLCPGSVPSNESRSSQMGASREQRHRQLPYGGSDEILTRMSFSRGLAVGDSRFSSKVQRCTRGCAQRVD